MPFFDSFIESTPTGPGQWLMRRLNCHHLLILHGLAPQARRVVEIGPGVGAFAEACRKSSMSYCAVEPSPKICQALRRQGHQVVEGLVPPMPFADRSADVVHASHVIEHNPSFREAMDFLQESRRVVDVGGLVSIVAPDFDHFGNEFWKIHYSHSLPINQRRLTQLMVDNSLEIRHAGYLSGPFRSPLRWLTQTLAWTLSARLIWLLTLGRLNIGQCYSAKLTFMRAIWVVGQRTF